MLTEYPCFRCAFLQKQVLQQELTLIEMQKNSSEVIEVIVFIIMNIHSELLAKVILKLQATLSFIIT